MEVEEAEKEGGDEYVISKLSKFIERKCHSLEYEIRHKFEEFANQYDADKKRLKEQLKIKFEKVNRHLDESVFTILSKGQRFESDLDKIYKKMLKLFVAPNHQNIAKTMFLREQQCKTPLNISDYIPPKCDCGKTQLTCEFLKTPVVICPQKPPMNEQRSLDCDKNDENVLYTWLTPQRKHILDKPTYLPGQNQSPIEISEAIPIKMPAIEMIGYRNLLPAPIVLRNNNSTGLSLIPQQFMHMKRTDEPRYFISVELTAGTLTEKEVKLGDFVPYITGGKLNGQYEFVHIQFRWGKENTCGAEHVFNNIHYPAEMQIVHKNKKYATMETALKNSDGVAILAFFFQMSEFDGPEIKMFAEKLHNLQYDGDAVEMGITFSLFTLLRTINLNQFYTYKGSLTTPPYQEAVTWVIFPDTLKISPSQMHKFRQLLRTASDENAEGNFREVQPLGNRRIFLRQAYRKGCPINNNEIHYTKWEWYKERK